MTRRRFLTITASLVASPAAAFTEWRGQALGARARILIDHPDSAEIAAEALAEIARLEAIFSLCTESALTRLNRDGRLAAPPFELLECLALCGSVHAATGGLFDPTIQPLWALYAEGYSAGQPPRAEQIARVLERCGWAGLSFDAQEVRLAPGMALTLNGVAQGCIADRVSALLQARGLRHVLVDTGELRAPGPRADGAPWPVTLARGGHLGLAHGGLASSSALGTLFDAAGQVGHILSPLTGLPAVPRWKLVTVTAPGAGLADALSTAACLMESEAQIARALSRFEGARLAHLA
ncbi:FAD:protein FMN transferase [Rhodobacteraceae bacterium CYK-10]|uniref:FAD:protein FMN transferase n=1 Tax=Stagnihabitans tardus TaxID=2699202 RepID=A0AAE4YF93_9RHOB|nr:FAD:protein FMN transferase [Stagnihabitans tardus]NBZ89129.1 FAD:protein FMN transferase [Stagnihabitans tardus]